MKPEEGRRALEGSAGRKSNGTRRNFKPPAFHHFHSAADREGIDLVGERLIGAIIVGVGLPQLCIERDLIRDYFQQQNVVGFDYAYTYPGMNRVLQSVGRVIRSETDCGVVLLIDARFSEVRYRRLFPPWWKFVRVRHSSALGDRKSVV